MEKCKFKPFVMLIVAYTHEGRNNRAKPLVIILRCHRPPSSSCCHAVIHWVVMGHWESLVKGNIINQSRQPDIQHSRTFQRGNHSHSSFPLNLSLVCICAWRASCSASINSLSSPAKAPLSNLFSDAQCFSFYHANCGCTE